MCVLRLSVGYLEVWQKCDTLHRVQNMKKLYCSMLCTTVKISTVKYGREAQRTVSMPTSAPRPSAVDKHALHDK